MDNAYLFIVFLLGLLAVGDLIVKELQEKNNSKNSKEEDINIRLNRLLSGSGASALDELQARAGTHKRINKLIYKN